MLLVIVNVFEIPFNTAFRKDVRLDAVYVTNSVLSLFALSGDCRHSASQILLWCCDGLLFRGGPRPELLHGVRFAPRSAAFCCEENVCAQVS
jgi:hypothetical protein